jgi:hypothetical protein
MLIRIVSGHVKAWIGNPSAWSLLMDPSWCRRQRIAAAHDSSIKSVPPRNA